MWTFPTSTPMWVPSLQPQAGRWGAFRREGNRAWESGCGRKSGIGPYPLLSLQLSASQRVGTGEVDGVTCGGGWEAPYAKPPSLYWKQSWQEFQLTIYRQNPKLYMHRYSFITKNVTSMLIKYSAFRIKETLSLFF